MQLTSLLITGRRPRQLALLRSKVAAWSRSMVNLLKTSSRSASVWKPLSPFSSLDRTSSPILTFVLEWREEVSLHKFMRSARLSRRALLRIMQSMLMRAAKTNWGQRSWRMIGIFLLPIPVVVNLRSTEVAVLVLDSKSLTVKNVFQWKN